MPCLKFFNWSTQLHSILYMVLVDLWPFFSLLVLSSPSCATCIPYILSTFPAPILSCLCMCFVTSVSYISSPGSLVELLPRLSLNVISYVLPFLTHLPMSSPLPTLSQVQISETVYFSSLYFITVPLKALIGSNGNHYMPQWDYQFLKDRTWLINIFVFCCLAHNMC